MPVQRTSSEVQITYKSSSVGILLYGATVVSWKAPSPGSTEPIERLFVSSKASTDGTKPVRGGIPVVFPCFGAPTHPDHALLGQHGFARSTVWKFDSIVMDNEAGVSVRLTLEPTESVTSKFSKPFHLAYVVTLAEHQISTDLHVKNISSSDVLEFQALLHNYIRAPSQQIGISSLTGLSYYDKTESTEELRSTPKTESRALVDVKQFTDFIYENASGDYQIHWAGSKIGVRATGFKDVVIWNPHAEAASKIGDMEEGGWERYVCVEPGYVRGFVNLSPGATWVGQQVISVLE